MIEDSDEQMFVKIYKLQNTSDNPVQSNFNQFKNK